MSFILAIVAVELFVIGAQSPYDPLLLVISSNPVVMLLRLVLVGAAVVLAYKKRFKYKISHKIAGWAGGLMAAAGLCGMLSQTIADTLSVYIKYLDFWMLCVLGIVFILISLSVQPGFRRLQLQKTLVRHAPKAWPARLAAGGSLIFLRIARR